MDRGEFAREGLSIFPPQMPGIDLEVTCEVVFLFVWVF